MYCIFFCLLQLSYDNGIASLVMSEAFPKNGGLYTAVAKNTAGEVQCSATVSVKVIKLTLQVMICHPVDS